MRTYSSWRPAAAIVAAVVALDLGSKAAVSEFAGSTGLWFIHPVENHSSTAGLAGSGDHVLVATVLALVLFTAWLSTRLARGLVRPLPVGLTLGGATANVIDRIGDGAVFDFLATPWLIVNLADLATLLGVGLLLGSALAGTIRGRANHASHPTADSRLTLP